MTFEALSALRAARSPAGDGFTPCELAVFVSLVLRADVAGCAYPSLERLAVESKCARSTAALAVKRLEREGWLSRGWRPTQTGMVRSYTLHPPPEVARDMPPREDRPTTGPPSDHRTPVRPPDPRPTVGLGSSDCRTGDRPTTGPELPMELPMELPINPTPLANAPTRDAGETPDLAPAVPAAAGPDLEPSEAEQLRARLASHPCLAGLAVGEAVSEQLAAPVVALALPLADALAALDDLARDEGARAAAAGAKDLGALAQLAARYIAQAGRARRMRPASSTATSSPRTCAKALRLWERLYAASGRKYGPYTPRLDDPARAATLEAQAREIARGEAERRGAGADVELLVGELLEHWFKAYLRDDGVRHHLVEGRHPLHLLERGIPTYGRPWKAGRPPPSPAPSGARPQRAPPPEEAYVPPPPEALAALAQLGRGRGVAKLGGGG